MLNTKQEKAVKALESAFKLCKTSNVAFFMMDSSLMAFDADYIDPLMLDPNTDMGSLQQSDPDFESERRDVEDHRTLRDCGGW